MLDGLIGVKLKFLIAVSIRKEALSSRFIKRVIKIRFLFLSFLRHLSYFSTSFHSICW